MLVFGTEMHVVTFIFAILEIALFSYQLIYYLSRPQDKGRYWYLILLFLLIVYNLTGGLFPDPNISIPIVVQNIIAYGSGFIMASYFPFYFYKGFELHRLRFHAVYGVLLFLLLPYLVFFVIEYSIHQNLDYAIKYGIVVPFFYSLVLLWAIIKAVYLKYRENRNNWEVIAVCFAVVPWVSMTVLAYLHASQLIEVIFTNGGFVVITIIFISKSITQAKLEYQQLMDLTINGVRPTSFQENCLQFQFTKREIEIVQLLRQGLKYQIIANNLHISELTVKTHVQNIFEKAGTKSRTELIHKLENQ